MKLIVGLGNPGKEYENTRHNSGFCVMDAIAEDLHESITTKKFKALTCVTRILYRGTSSFNETSNIYE